jgi:acyl-CoA reductase-like NAD-dependent aldehyde dehydrogenase
MTQDTIAPAHPDLFNRDSLYIAGRWTTSAERKSIEIINPYTEEVLGTVPEANEADAEAAIAAAVEAHRSNPWKQLTFVQRGEILDKAADGIRARSEDIAETYVKDFGGLRAFAGYNVEAAAAVFAEHKRFAEELEAQQWRDNGGEKNLLLREPVGPVLAIVPWNASLVLAIVKLAPALLAGCPVVIKSDPASASVTFILAEVLEEVGIPEGMVSILPGTPESMGDLTVRPEFAHIAFTGSTATGRKIMHAAAENITDVTLELGGKSAAIFLEDLDPAAGAPLVVMGSLGQSGQVCTTYSRLLVPESRGEEWITTLTELFKSLPIGDPNEEGTAIGPLVNDTHRARVEKYIEIAKEEGATILAGGKRPDIPTGYFVEPTLVGDVTVEMRIVQEEVFGPVINVQTYRDLDDAVEIANSTEYGLAAAIFTANPDAALPLAARLEAGNVAINNFAASLVHPFGGYKSSGLGREGGIENVLHLLAIKQVRMPAEGLSL